jgi:tyrosyl-tRNA synthetase
MATIEAWKVEVSEGTNPRDIKFKLAQELIERFHSKKDAEKSLANFIARFQKGAIPDEMDEYELEANDDGLPIAILLKGAKIVPSTSEAYRMIKQGAVKIDGQKVTGRNLLIQKGTTAVYQVGKRRFARVSVK